MDRLAGCGRDERLCLVGARLHDLETRTPGALDLDKWRAADEMLWRLVTAAVPDEDWLRFCEREKIRKYLRTLENRNAGG